MQTEYTPFGQMRPVDDLSETRIASDTEVPSSSTIFSLEYVLSWIPFYSILYPSSPYSITKSTWFKWYYILPALFVFFYIIALTESMLDSRRNANKEGMHQDGDAYLQPNKTPTDTKIKGILKKLENAERYIDVNKRVSFYKTTFELHNIHLHFARALMHGLRVSWNAWLVLYEWWILPWIYGVVRTIGFAK